MIKHYLVRNTNTGYIYIISGHDYCDSRAAKLNALYHTSAYVVEYFDEF